MMRRFEFLTPTKLCLLLTLAAVLSHGQSAASQAAHTQESINGTINVMSAPYNAKCDGTTDDTAAIQSAINAEFASARVPTTLSFPAGKTCVVSQLNLTNNFGTAKGSSGSIHIVGASGPNGRQSTIECQEASPNTGVCFDFSGSDAVSLENVFISNGINPPEVTMLLARTGRPVNGHGTRADLGFSSGFVFSHLTLYYQGRFGLYSYGGEVVNCVDCNIAYVGKPHDNGESNIVLSSGNSHGIASPFQTLETGWVSMSQVSFDKGSVVSCQNIKGPCIELDNTTGLIHSNTFDGYYNLGGDSSTRVMIADTGKGQLHDISLGPSKFRVEGNCPSPPCHNQLAVLGSSSIKGFVVRGTFNGGPSVTGPEINFSNPAGLVGEGSIINLQPGDSQASYPGYKNPGVVVSCAMPSTNIIGLVIYDRNAYGGVNTLNRCPGDIEFPGVSGGWSIDGAGNLSIPGSLTAKGTKNFKIDHPLDPTNKYLVHASVESSEMMNIYSGNVTTDSQGEATVQLPQWFEALNTDFRYQLTVVGQFAQAIVAREIQSHEFAIRTSVPNVKVSWQVTGVRQDAYAKAHPLVVEEEKYVPVKGATAGP